jgi:hypothetical protein
MNHCIMSLRVLAYLRDHDLAIQYDPIHFNPIGDDLGAMMLAYSDSDWAGCVNTRRSVNGGVIMALGGPIVWHSRLQTTVARSSTEAEYISLGEVIKDVLYMRGIAAHVERVEVGMLGMSGVLVDNQGAVHMGYNNSTTRRSRHMDVRYHFVREYVARGAIELEYVQSALNLADVMTKSLSREDHRRLTAMMMKYRWGTETPREQQTFHWPNLEPSALTWG